MLLAVLVFDFAGVLVLFKVQQVSIRREIKRQIKRGLREDELHVITVTAENKHELTWEEENEFEYRGNMYDVVRQETLNGSTKYFCINDRQEETLFANLEDLSRRKADSHSPNSMLVKKIADLFANVEAAQQTAFLQPSCLAGCYGTFQLHKYPTPYMNIVVPPPQSPVSATPHLLAA